MKTAEALVKQEFEDSGLPGAIVLTPHATSPTSDGNAEALPLLTAFQHLPS